MNYILFVGGRYRLKKASFTISEIASQRNVKRSGFAYTIRGWENGRSRLRTMFMLFEEKFSRSDILDVYVKS